MSAPLIANQIQASHIIPARQASDIISQRLCDSFAEFSHALQSKLFHSKAIHKIRNFHMLMSYIVDFIWSSLRNKFCNMSEAVFDLRT